MTKKVDTTGDEWNITPLPPPKPSIDIAEIRQMTLREIMRNLGVPRRVLGVEFPMSLSGVVVHRLARQCPTQCRELIKHPTRFVDG